MIEFRIDTDILDLVPGATTSLESSSPFFSSDVIEGEYSLPIEFAWTEKNLRVFGYLNELPVIKDKVRILDVDYSENGLHFYKGTLVVEFVQGHLQGFGQGRISGYFLMGTSNFFQRIKNVRLRDLYLGGDRKFSWNGFSITNDGFWKHCHDTWNATSDTMDYVFAPILNEAWEGDDSESDFINKLQYNGLYNELHWVKNWNTLVAHPYHIYILKQIFSENNYSLSGKILADPGFKKLYMPSLQAIYWCKYDPEAVVLTPNDEITINVAKQLPDYSIAEYLIAMGNKFGFGYEFSRTSRACEIKLFRDIPADSRRIDFTSQIAPTYQINFPTTPNVISITQTMDGSDAAIGSIDFNSVNLAEEIDSYADLPAHPSVGDCHLVVQENAYYAWLGTEDSLSPFWQKIGDNIFDYIQENDTIEITTGISTCAMRPRLKYMDTDEGVVRTGTFVEIKQLGNWKAVLYNANVKPRIYAPRPSNNSPAWESILAGRLDLVNKLTGPTESFNNWTMRAVFYWGMQPDDQGTSYPYSANHNFSNTGVKLGNWSLAYKCSTFGLIDQFWAFWLQVLQEKEQLTATIYPPLHQYMQLQWSDILLVRNTPYLVQKRTATSPWNGMLPVVAYRLPALRGQGVQAPGTYPVCIIPDGLASTVVGGKSVTLSWNAVAGYDYVVQYSTDNFATIAGFSTIVGAAPDGTGKISWQSPDLPQDGSTYKWRVAHIHCGSGTDQGAWAAGPNFTIETNAIQVSFVFSVQSVSDHPLLQVTLTATEAVAGDVTIKGHLVIRYPNGSTGRAAWTGTIPARLTSHVSDLYGVLPGTTVVSGCWDSITPASSGGKVLQVAGDHC